MSKWDKMVKMGHCPSVFLKMGHKMGQHFVVSSGLVFYYLLSILSLCPILKVKKVESIFEKNKKLEF